MAEQITDYPYGVEIIEGLMGAGKSYYAVRRVCQTIEETRRPVYTNLPLRWKVVRAYLALRGGRELASLIHPLKERHWRAFLRRQHAYALFREERGGRAPSQLEPEQLQALAEANNTTTQRLTRQDRIHSAQMAQWFRHEFGEEVYEGNQADSIPLSAIIVIDEVQHWHPMHNQRNEKDAAHLQAYLTMCRHHLHWIWVITQDRSRINIIFRLLCQNIWRVWDRGEDRLAWGIRFKHLGLRGMGYERYTREQFEGTNPDNARPSESFTIMPQRRKNRVYFRLYSSFTQAGSKRQIMRMLKKARKNAGLSEEGKTETELNQHTEEPMKQNKKSLIRRIIGLATKATIVTIISVIAFAIGAATTGIQTHDETPEATTEQAAIEWPRFNGVTKNQPIFDGQPAKKGDKIGTHGELVYYDPDRRSAVLLADGGYWLWEYTKPIPRPVGEVGIVQNAFEQWEKHGQRTPQEVFVHAPAGSDETLEPTDDHNLSD